MKNGEIKDQNQIEEIATQVNMAIIQKWAEKATANLENRIQSVSQNNDEEKVKNLYLEVIKLFEKIKGNAYIGQEIRNRTQNLYKQLENIHMKKTSTNPDEFP
jgi:hypothetical protein